MHDMRAFFPFKDISLEHKEGDKDKLVAILDESEGYYLIGDKSKASDIFCLSVTIVSAKNLTQV